jgi:CRISPR-associated protein Cas1
MKNLRTLPKVRDSWSHLYVEHCRVEQEDKAIALFDAAGKVAVPCATLSLLMLGPGTKVTHAAVRTLADSGCLVMWTGEEGVRFYAEGMGETRSSRNLMRQARLWANPSSRLEVVRTLYAIRFPEPLEPELTLQQIRGKEGVRVRDTYAKWSRETGVPWSGRSYQRQRWAQADPINRALSAANSCLYGICHAAIVAAGFSTALGFIHTGKMLSFVYDVADLYKTETTIPAAFQTVADGAGGLESRVRQACRDQFRESRILKRIVSDIQKFLDIDEDVLSEHDLADDPPGGIWDPTGVVEGGRNWGDEEGG